MGDSCQFVNIFLVVLVTISVSSSTPPRNPQRRITRQIEDIENGNYKICWDVDFDTQVITFEIEAATTGYVGFGISPTGGMVGADIVIGGVDEFGQTFFEDRHAVGESMPIIDDTNNYVFISASENSTHTHLKFSRFIDTCDKTQDVAITADTQKIIWSYGATDDLTYHGVNRGSLSVNFLDPPTPPIQTGEFDLWSLERTLTMPAQSTIYWCTIHRSPAAYNKERHIVGFNTRLDGPDSLAYTHHLNVYKCTAPPGENPDNFFGPFVGQPGGECYAAVQTVPTSNCRSMWYVWAVGGRPMFFPEHVGFPINENGAAEYVMMEIHYDNPAQLENVSFTSAVEVFSTTELRQDSAAGLLVGHAISFSHLMPPRANEFLTVGHCGPACTGRTIDSEGIKLVNVMLHSHLLGRKMRLRHFRERKELPWIAVDDNYDFDFQQNRPLREDRLVLPGDQLTMECTTDSTERNGTTIGGLSTAAEMCQAIIWYYPRGDLRYCESSYDEWKILERFGIESITWENFVETPTITAPASMAGKSLTEGIDDEVQWTPTLIAELQQELSYTEHNEFSCGPTAPYSKIIAQTNFIGYPELDEEYAPVDQCDPIPIPTSTPIM